jgi:hypothetical protein
MYLAVHPATTMMRGDGDGYNPRNLTFYNGPGGSEMIEGVFQDDGRTDTAPRRPDIPFTTFLPPDFVAWHELTAKIYYALRAGQSPVLIDMRR